MITQFTMGSFGVVVVPPSFDNNSGFPQLVEDFAVQQFVPIRPLNLPRSVIACTQRHSLLPATVID